MDDNTDIISINTYDETLSEYTSFPYIGWFKPCYYINCNDITSNYLIFYYRKNRFKLYICKRCKKKYKNHLNQSLYNYVEDYYKKYYG